jgi:glutamate-1-semialdehyde 2,1-aminomutase
MAAGLATLRLLSEAGIYETLEQRGTLLFTGLESAARSAGLEVTVNHIGSLGSLFFTPGPVTDYDSARTSDQGLFVRYYKGMLEQGIYLAPSPFEAAFLSIAHSEETIQKTIDCAARAFRSL